MNHLMRLTLCSIILATATSLDAQTDPLTEAQSLYQQQRYDQAAALLERLAAEKPNEPDVHRLLAHTYYQLERFDDARASANRAIALGRLTADLLRRLAQIEQRAGRNATALNALRIAAVIDPNSADLLLTLAVAAETAGQPAEAQGAYQQLIDADPADPALWLRLGNLHLKTDNAAGALTPLTMAYHLGDRTGSLVETIAELHAQQDDPRQALIWLSRSVATDAQQIDNNQIRRAQLAFAGGDLPLAQQLSTNLTNSNDPAVSQNAHLILAQTAQQQEQLAPTLLHFQAAAALGSIDPQIPAYLGQHYFRQEDYENASRYLTAALTTEQPDADLLAQLITTLVHLSQADAARAHLITYLEHHPLDARGQRLIALLP